MKLLVYVCVALGAALNAFTVTDAQALANSGVVYGRMRFYQNQGNYCPTASCNGIGTRYPQSEFQQMRPVRNATVFLATTSGTQLGYSTTNADGDYTIAYDTNGSVSSVYVYWIPEEVGGRFRLVTSTGGYNNMTTAAQSLTAGTGQSKNWGTKDFGTNLASVSVVANVWDGAQRTYYDALDNANAMVNNFTGIEMYMDKQATCPSSCYWSAANGTIYLNNAGYFMPQERVMHELGHAASYLASLPERSDYGTLSTGCGYNGGGWLHDTSQPDCSATEEGFATFISTYALYLESAGNPRTCFESDDCYDGGSLEYNIEAFDTVCGSFGADSSWPWTTLGYLWDAVDSNDTVNIDFVDVIDTYGAFDSGFGNRDVNEQYDASWVLEYADGRNVRDIYNNMRYEPDGPLLDTESALNANCGNL